MPQIKLVDESGSPLALKLVDESGVPLSRTISPTLLESRKAASASEFTANQPESTIASRAREAAIGILEPYDLHNVPDLVKTLSGAIFETLSGKGSGKAQEILKGMVMAPVRPVQNIIGGLASGDYDRAAYGAGGFASTTVPGVVSAIDLAKRVGSPLKAGETPVDLYRQSMQRGVKSGADVSAMRDVAKTGVEYKIPVSEEGVTKLEGLIQDLESKVTAAAEQATQQGVTVNKYGVASRLTETAQKAAVQAVPQPDLATISEAGNQFLEAHPGQMPADYAQAVKKGTYQQLKGKYGKAGTAQIEAEKALARGIKEELARQVPEIADLTAEQSKLIQLDKVLEQAVNRAANSRGSFLKDVLTTGVAKSITGSGPIGVVAGVLRHVWSDPVFKSKLAIAVNYAQKNNPGKWGPPNVATATARAAALTSGLNPNQAAASADRQ